MINLRKINLEEFENKCLNMYESLFPKEERRKFDSIITSYLDGIENFYIIELDNKAIGFITLEHLSNHPYYLEYFGIIKEYQSMGYGTDSIKRLIELVGDEGIIGEIEDINSSESSRKRLEFYKRLGFVWINHLYDLYTVLYNPISYNYSEDITKSLFDYYEANMGIVNLKRNCKVIK